jgi:hypothetical protein
MAFSFALISSSNPAISVPTGKTEKGRVDAAVGCYGCQFCERATILIGDLAKIGS